MEKAAPIAGSVMTAPALDIMVQPQQRICSVLEVLRESGRLGLIDAEDKVYLRSWRRGVYLEDEQTFKQAGIWTGDIIYIEVEAHE